MLRAFGRVAVVVKPFVPDALRQAVAGAVEVPDDATTIRFEGFSGAELVISNTLDLGA